ncbi:MAG: regulatory iron-sulfur-containing complex subunit RicT [Saprospiraceae bacterium]
MGCSSCSIDSNGTPTGCGDKGHCTSGSCNKHNAYDWISSKEMFDPSEYHIVEVSFKKGSHKEFFINDPYTRSITGDMVVVETSSGYDVGRISLSGELVRLQMKKKYTNEDRVALKVIRKANERDLEKLEEARDLEKETMVRARVISRIMGLDMKIGDVEYQGDKKKATFYYTAEGRVDFRELVKEYAREFKVKIEMRQIGARQESARIGGIGSCGRELCCSTWLSDFKSVNTAAARYQNIAINQSKLSGQCGRLKCCLNYELDTYMDALEDFPDDADLLKTKAGTLVLIKTDIFKGLMYYVYENNDKMRGTILAVSTTRAKEVKEMNKKNILPKELVTEDHNVPVITDPDDENMEHQYEDVTGQIELRNEPKKKKKKPFRKDERRSGRQQDMPKGNSQNSTGTSNDSGRTARENKRPNERKVNDPNPQNRQHKSEQRPPASNVNPGSNDNTSSNSGDNQQQNNAPKKKKFFNKNRKPKDGQGQ